VSRQWAVHSREGLLMSLHLCRFIQGTLGMSGPPFPSLPRPRSTPAFLEFRLPPFIPRLPGVLLFFFFFGLPQVIQSPAFTPDPCVSPDSPRPPSPNATLLYFFRDLTATPSPAPPFLACSSRLRFFSTTTSLPLSSFPISTTAHPPPPSLTPRHQHLRPSI